MASARIRSILLPGSCALLLLLTACMTVFLSACKTDNPVEPSGSALDGAWHVMKANTLDVSAQEIWWTFDKGHSSFWQGSDNCTTSINYTSNATKIFTAIVADECGDSQPGEKDTIAYTIAGNQMTLTRGADVMILQKSTTGIPPMIYGNWTVTTVDGQGPQPGNAMTISFDAVEMLVKKTSSGQSCETSFEYEKSGANKLNVDVVDDECSGLEPGTTDTITWSIAGNVLTLVFGDGTTIKAKK